MPNLVDRFVKVFTDMEPVMNNIGHWKKFVDRCCKRLPHIEGYWLHCCSLWWHKGLQELFRAFQGSTLNNIKNSASNKIIECRNVVMAGSEAFLINTDVYDICVCPAWKSSLYCTRNMSIKMSRVYKINHSIVSGFKTTSRVTLHCLTSRDPHRSGYARWASRIVAFLLLKIASACPVRICSGVT